MSQTTPNAHVHPVFRDILNAIAERPQQAALHADFSAVAASVKAKHEAKQAAQRAALPPLPAVKLETRDEKIVRLQAELAAARSGFDANYDYSEDFDFVCRQQVKARTIVACRRELSALGVAL